MGRLEECGDFKKTVFNLEVGREIFASVVFHSILLIFLIVNIGVGEAPPFISFFLLFHKGWPLEEGLAESNRSSRISIGRNKA